ncbi:MAG: outer membrane protein assembly factor BamD [Bacteroidota bacterium]
MSQKFIINFILVGLILFAGGCKFRKIQKNPDWKVKYEAALDYYNNKDYYHANVLFEEIIPLIRGTEEAELANYYYAYTYYYQKQYLLSAHYFKSFYEIYGRSEFAMDAQYMRAYSLYLQSPESSLDQTSTYEAMTALQNFINKYPYVELAEKADVLIKELRVKLETKAFDKVVLFFNLRRTRYTAGGYQAALTTADNFHNEYPDSEYNPEVLYMEIVTAHEYAENSFRIRQKERFEHTVELYEKLVDNYPDSKFIKQAEKFYEDSIEQLSIFADQN